MFELAYNVNGEPFDVPPTMAAWRVRKLKPKGAPEVVYGRDGLPLFLPMDADIEDLRREARGDGRYRLDPVDEHNRTVPNAQAGYVCVHPIERAPEPVTPEPPAAPTGASEITAALVAALLESQRQHTELARMYVSQFPVVANAMAGVVRSAGDVGLVGRVPLVVPVAPEIKPAEPSKSDAAQEGERDAQDHDENDGDEEDEEEVEVVEVVPVPEWSWPKVAATVVERFSPQIDALLGQLPALSAALGARRAQRAANDQPTGPASGAAATDVTAHLSAILAALTSDEAAKVKALADELPMAEKIAYLQTLRGMSVPEATAYVRRELAKLGRNSAQGATAASDVTMSGVAMSDAQIDAHIGAIRAAMAPEESETVRVMLEELIYEHRLIWVEKLCEMSVAEAVAFLRQKLAEAQRDATARGAVGPRVVRVARAVPSSAAPHAAPVPPTAPRPSAPGKLRRDGRRATGSPAPSTPPPATSTAPAPTGGAPTGGLGMISPTAQARLDAIQSGLTGEEDMAVRTYLAALSAAERSAWIGTLLSLPVPEAVAMIRAQRSADRASTAPQDDTAHHPAVAAAEAAPRNVAPMTSVSLPTAPQMPPVSAGRAALDDAPSAPVLASVESPAPTSPAAPLPTVETTPVATQPDAAPREPNADVHLLAIELALTAAERLRVHTRVAQMSPDDREILLDQLLSASVPQGAAILRRAASQEQLPPTAPTDADRITDAHALDERQALDDAETLDDAEPLDDAEELGEDSEELGEDHEPDDDRAEDAPEPADPLSGEGPELAEPPIDTPRTAIASTAVPSADLPTLPPEAFAHFQAIDAALTLAERMRVFEAAARFSPTELRQWVQDLTVLPVPEAVAKVRAALAVMDRAAPSTTKGGVS